MSLLFYALFNSDPTATYLYTLSLHDALPISGSSGASPGGMNRATSTPALVLNPISNGVVVAVRAIGPSPLLMVAWSERSGRVVGSHGSSTWASRSSDPADSESMLTW